MNIHEFVKNNFNKNSLFFEIGSHFGVDTLELIKTTKNIHCFEPDFRNINIFKEYNMPVILNEFAISDKDGEVEFYLSSGNVYQSKYGPTNNSLINSKDWSASSSIKKPKNHLVETPWVKFNEKIKVKSQRLDTYCNINKINEINFIWVDVQGAELEVINGLGDFINNVEFIYTEYSDNELYENQPNKNKILQILGDNWVTIFDFGGDILIKNKEFNQNK